MFHIGEIILVAFTYAPPEFVVCNGQLLSINNYQALFSLLGTRYGGNGTTTFAVPNLTAPTGLIYIICTDGFYPQDPNI